MTYVPTAESAANCAALLDRLSNPREFARISGRDRIGSVNFKDLPSKATIKKYTVGIAKPAPNWMKAPGHHEPTGSRPSHQPLSDAEKEHIMRLCYEGKTCKQIAVELDLYSQTVATHMRRNGVVMVREKGRINGARGTPNTDRMTPAVIETIKRMAAAGLTSSQIAYHTQISRQYITYWCNREGVELVACNLAHMVCPKTGRLLHKGTRQPVNLLAA